ncbi:MAG: hypothetical protein ACI8RZ_004104 [Myxococcota bacterium]|jgi:hypothetical protein
MPADTPHTEAFTRLELERWALGRLEPARAEALTSARAADPDLDERAQHIQAEIQSAARDMPPLHLPVEADPWWRRLLTPPPMAFAGLALAAAVTLAVILPDEPTPDGRMLTRGAGIGLQIVRVRDGQADNQASLIRAQTGDRIQYTLTAESDGHVAVYNLQDDGTIKAYRTSEPISSGETVESAVLLDDYAGSERIFFLLDAEPITDEMVSGAVQRAWRAPLADLDVLPGAAEQQRSVLIVKGEDSTP